MLLLNTLKITDFLEKNMPRNNNIYLKEILSALSLVGIN